MNRPNPSSDSAELDRKFSEFFHTQVPQPWPVPMAVARAEPASRRSSGSRDPGRITLAVSVACLLGLGLALSYGPQFRGANPSRELFDKSNADGKNLHKHMNPADQPKLP